MANEREVQDNVKKAMAKAQGSLVRLDELEKTVDGLSQSVKQIVMAVNSSLGQLNRSLDEYKEMLNAVIGILGPEQVQDAIVAARAAALERNAAETRASIAQALEQGDIVATELTTEKSVVAGAETKADGSVVPPGWAFVPMSKIDDPYREQLMGKPVGTQIPTKEGGKFTLLEIYEVVEKPAAAPPHPVPSEAVVDAVATPLPAQDYTTPALDNATNREQ